MTLRGRWMECVPNFSEGRDAAKVLDIARAAEEAGATLLDVHLDPDHNRSVLTLAGEPERLVPAVLTAVRRAVALLDLRAHSGAHPRIGIADVIPFVPGAGVTEEDCVRAARDLAARLAEELEFPVYLYERAAVRPERRNLADVRREHAAALAAGAPLSPDIGPPRPHPSAGAVAVGARRPLVALNCYLAGPDVSAARRIAARVRASGGGLPGVKALGLRLESAGRAQVSMNVTDVGVTPPHAAVERVADLARAEGAALAESELVGLLPLDSVLRAAVSALGLQTLEPRQVLELALQEKEVFVDLEAFLEELASAAPTPGGGAASALAGALAAALGAMVCNLTVGRPRYADVEPQLREALDELEGLSARLRRLMDEDEEAYASLMARYKLPKDTPEELQARTAAIEGALRHAADIPLETARACVDVLAALARIAGIANRNVISDAGAGALLAEAACRATLLNVRTNAALMKDRAAAEEYLRAMSATEATARDLAHRSVEQVAGRIG